MKDYNKIMAELIKKVKGKISEPNRTLILDFVEKDIAKNIGPGRISEFRTSLKSLCLNVEFRTLI